MHGDSRQALNGRLVSPVAPQNDSQSNNAQNTDTSSGGSGDQQQQQQTQNEFKPPASQEELDRIITARLERERAKYSDYEANKADAEKFRQLQDKDKTDAQREKDRADAAEKRAAKAEWSLLRAEVAEAKGVPAKLLSGETKEELEKAADDLIEFRGEQKQDRRPRSSSLDRIDHQNNPVQGSTGDIFADFVEKQM